MTLDLPTAPGASIVPLRLTGAGDPRFAAFGGCVVLRPNHERIAIPFDCDGQRGDARLTIITAGAAQRGPIRQVERHPYSVQVLLPLVEASVVAVVSSASSPPTDASALEAFIVPPGFGVLYWPGIWHCGLMGIGADVPVASFIRRTADGNDTVLADLPFSFAIAEPTP